MNQTQFDGPLVASLAEPYRTVNDRHAASRATLLKSLADESPSIAHEPNSLIARQYIAGGLGVGAIAAAIMAAFWFAAPPSPAAAMERMAKALEQINAYSYRMEKVYVSRRNQGRTVRQNTIGSWRTTPVGMRAIMQIVETVGTNAAIPDAPRKLVDLEEVHQVGAQGVLIDHIKHEYWRVNGNIEAHSIPPGSPQVAVFMVQQRRGRVLRDLGEARIAGRTARGIELLIDDSQPVSELGPTTTELSDGQADIDWRNMKVEVWIDPKTDLPIAFQCGRRGDDFETNYRFTDLRWNEEFTPDAFDAVIPEGYTEREIAAAPDQP